MTKIRYQKATTSDGLVLRRTQSGDNCGGVETVLRFGEGQEELADEVTAMLNALQVRKDFDAHRINSMRSVQDDDLAQRTGDEHGSVLPVLQELAREVGKAVLAWTRYADHIWALLTPPELPLVHSVERVRGGTRSLSDYSRNCTPEGSSSIFEESMDSLRKLYGSAMANVRAYENYLEEIQRRIDQEFGHLPQPPEDGPYRLGSKQNRNIYFHEDGGEIGGKFLGVAFDPEDAKTIKDALNKHYHEENS